MASTTPQFRKKCRRYDIPGQSHYLTFSCFHRQPFLSGKLAPVWLADAIEAARAKLPFYLWAFVFMPEHVHLLIQPRDGSEISPILWSIKRPVTEKAVRHVRRHNPDFLLRMLDVQPDGKQAHRFWQRGGGYDRNIFSREELIEKIHYIHNNPLRRGLVEKPSDWHWLSYRAWQEGIDVPLKIDRGLLRQT